MLWAAKFILRCPVSQDDTMSFDRRELHGRGAQEGSGKTSTIDLDLRKGMCFNNQCQPFRNSSD